MRWDCRYARGIISALRILYHQKPVPAGIESPCGLEFIFRSLTLSRRAWRQPAPAYKMNACVHFEIYFTTKMRRRRRFSPYLRRLFKIFHLCSVRGILRRARIPARPRQKDARSRGPRPLPHKAPDLHRGSGCRCSHRPAFCVHTRPRSP